MKYELLAPVGDFRNLRAAVETGADAVYFGIKGFNMRDSAKNFSLRNLKKMREICGGVKMYLTLNVVMYDEELAKIEKIVKGAKKYVDAIICWDLAVIELCRKYKVPFHVSTQASISNVSAAKFYKKLGAERVVLARELSLKQIAKISKIVDVECFCHGAMCVAVSGRCFMSQHVHGLSANRGKCAQLCRRAWHVKDDNGNELKMENSRVMSAKDLCALPFIDRMKKAGIVSFKIEGRNRSPEYVYTVVSEYRKALDKDLSRAEIVSGIESLKKVYNRGFSSGFYLKVPTNDDFSFSENGEQSESKIFVGKVYKYWPKVGACSVLINTGKLKVGDEVYLISDDIGVKRSVVKSIELKGKSVDVAKKGDDVGVDFGMRVGKCEVYVVGKRVK
jgi:U32 family peptidase